MDGSGAWSADRDCKERARALAEWHELLVERLADGEAEALLDRLVVHPALHGAELTFVQARIAHVRGEADRARQLVHDCLAELPGHRDFLDFAERVGAPLPPRARELAAACPGESPEGDVSVVDAVLTAAGSQGGVRPQRSFSCTALRRHLLERSGRSSGLHRRM